MSYKNQNFTNGVNIQICTVLCRKFIRMNTTAILRQRHCIASYDQRIKNGGCAIAAVFVDKVRWTVLLAFTLNGELAIQQIKSRLNVSPSSNVRTKIYETLNIDVNAVPAFQSGGQQRDLAVSYEALNTYLPILREHNIDEVVIYFNGSGDEGHIDGVDFLPYSNEERSIGSVMVETRLLSQTFVNGAWLQADTVQALPIGDAISDHASQL